MLIVNNEQNLFYHDILQFLPKSFRRLLSFIDVNDAEEIRLRKGLPLIISFKDESYFINNKGVLTKNIEKSVIVSDEHIKEAIELISKSSLYTIENSIKYGFITIDNGHRIGICATMDSENKNEFSIRDISSLNYRISHEIKGVSDTLINKIVTDFGILNTIIISPPCCGKTTLLRDITRNISNMGYKVSVCDERNEISASKNGYSHYELGFNTDVLIGVPKKDAIITLTRTMSPQAIITDELGGYEDYETIKKAIYLGVGIIASVHSYSKESFLKAHPDALDIFDCFITLNRKNGPGTIEEIYIND